MKKTNFDSYLDHQLTDPAFADRFQQAGEVWDAELKGEQMELVDEEDAEIKSLVV